MVPVACEELFYVVLTTVNIALRQKRMLPGHVPVKQYETRSFRSPKEKKKMSYLDM